MDKKQAKTLIEETFGAAFDKGRFTNFIVNLLNLKTEQIEHKHPYSGNFIPDSYEQYISTLERIAKYTDGEHNIDVLIVKLKKEKSIERARTMQRNFVAKYLKGSRGGVLKDAALVAFVSPGGDDWRFSLVKMEYKFNEKNKVEEEFTPARRWSFLVGANENSHTAQHQLVNILADDENNPPLAQLEESFNIEKVTREFFEKYRELFLWTKETLDDVLKKERKIKEDFDAKGVNTVDFAKKLLGQIVFLYFLQKKGWFGVKRDANWGTGPKHFLRELFEGRHGTYKNFFNDILEPLFYEALRIDRSHDDDYYSRFDCKIPFLNGGLFDPISNYDWVHTDVLLPNDLFSNTCKTKEGDKGNGILDIFDRYNFTVKEDEPLEKEVAVDPEMLGKVFENLLDVKDRKSKGTYYTPREIVHYMCQQSLINYLHTECYTPSPSTGEGKGEGVIARSEATKQSLPSKEDLETLIKYGEQVGENEATVEAKGGETKTYSYKLPESIRQNAKLIDEKLANIKVCDPAIGSGAFPVGMMSEVVKIRNVLTTFLSHSESPLHLRERDRVRAEDRSIYSFKRECIEKSLYGVDIDSGAVEIAKLRLWLSLVVDEDDIKQIKPLPNLDYKIVCGNSLLGVEKDLFNSDLFSELERLKPLLFNETSPNKKQEYKRQIDELIRQITKGHKEFDFEVYFSEVFHEKKGFDVVIANPPYVSIKGIKWDDRRSFEKVFITAKGRFDLYALFLERAKNTSTQTGFISYIIPGKFVNNIQFEADRRMLIENGDVTVSFIDQKVFQEANVDNVIIFVQKNIRTDKSYKAYNFLSTHLELVYSTNLENIASNKYVFIFQIDDANNKIIEKIRRETIPLKTVCEVKDGIVAGEIKDILFLDEVKDRESKPLLFGKDIQKYFIQDPTKYVNYKPGEMMKIELKRKKGKRYGLWMRTPEIFERPKILTRKVGTSIIGAIDFKNFYYEQTLHSTAITNGGFDLKYILALYNSQLFNFYYRAVNSKGGNLFPQIRISSLEKLPIKKITKEEQKPFIDIVDKILAITKDGDYLQNEAKQTNVKEHECQIDQIVYDLYGLTKEEIKVVEGPESRKRD